MLGVISPCPKEDEAHDLAHPSLWSLLLPLMAERAIVLSPTALLMQQALRLFVDWLQTKFASTQLEHDPGNPSKRGMAIALISVSDNGQARCDIS